MIHKLNIDDLPIYGNRILMRVDFNVPLDKNLRITDDTRISAALHSIKYVLEEGGSLVLMSHLGRPKGVKTPALSLKPCADHLSEMLGVPVAMAPDCIGEEVHGMVQELREGQVLLLENLRFHSAEEHPDQDPAFAKELAEFGTLYVNDAFGTSHRSHSSTVAITKYFPGKAAAGFLLEKEIRFLGKTLTEPKRPFYAIIGGAKISSKLGVLKSLLKKVDALFIAGGMAYTFFKAQGIEIGESIHEEDLIPQAKELLELAEKEGKKIFLPIDHVIAQSLTETAAAQVLPVSKGIPLGYQGVDIGPKTLDLFTEKLSNGKTILWNGPVGIFEIAQFSTGTRELAKTIANLDATTIVGGGDSAAALQAAGYADRISHISTGGGATLDYIEFGTLPAIEALSDLPA